MGAVHRVGVVLAIVTVAAVPVWGQERDAARGAYFAAVAKYFRLPPSEVGILGDWEIAPDEIPAILFIARHAGVSPEALVALRRTGRSFGELVARYRIGASALHVPVRDQAPTGSLSAAYDRFRQVPVDQWRTIALSDADVVALVNVRVIAQTLGLSAEDVIGRTGSVSSFVELYWQLSR